MSLATVDSSVRSAPREREANDWYVEPSWAVLGLLDVQRFSGLTLDPACGGGNIVDVLAGRDMDAVGSDLVNRVGRFSVANFLEQRAVVDVVDNIITNPPFDLAEAFLRKALTVARHKVAFLLRLSWLEGRARRWVYDTTPLAAVHPFASRVSMPPGGSEIPAKGGAVAFAWFVWDHSHPVGAPPALRRIERTPTTKKEPTP